MRKSSSHCSFYLISLNVVQLSIRAVYKLGLLKRCGTVHEGSLAWSTTTRVVLLTRLRFHKRRGTQEGTVKIQPFTVKRHFNEYVWGLLQRLKWCDNTIQTLFVYIAHRRKYLFTTKYSLKYYFIIGLQRTNSILRAVYGPQVMSGQAAN